MISEKIRVVLSWSDGRYSFEKFEVGRHDSKESLTNIYIDENLYNALVEHEKQDAMFQDILMHVKERKNEEIDAEQMRRKLHDLGKL